MIAALVTGRSLPALVAALELAEVGLPLVVAADAVAAGKDRVAERDAHGHVAALLQRIAQPIAGSNGSVREELLPQYVRPQPPLLQSPAGEWLPQGTPQVFGVPATPLAQETIALLGSRAAMIAYLDRVRPLLTIGKARRLGQLVQSRMGQAVLARLLAPHVAERFGVSPHEVDVAIAAPGLNEAVSRAGALSAGVLAYAERHVARETTVTAAAGYVAVREALCRRLAHYGATLLDVAVTSLEQGANTWCATFADGTQLEARAVVADRGATLAATLPIDCFVHEVLPVTGRLCAEAECERPEWLAPHTEVLSHHEGAALRVRAGAAADRAGFEMSSEVVSLPTREAGVNTNAGMAELPAQHSVDAALIDAFAETAGELLAAAPAGDFLDEDLVQHLAAAAELRAAPFATLRERDQAQAALQQLREQQPTMLPIGRVLHGDDLGAALDWAQQEAIVLRRHLVGIDAPNASV